MEIAEKFAFRTEQFITFGLERAAKSELYCVASRTKAFILQLIYNHHCDERIFMEQSTLGDISKFMPSHGVPKNAGNIFNKATKQQQDRLLVDYHLMTEELKVGSERVALIQTRWSPPLAHPNQADNLPGHYYLAYLTNFGGCEIRRKHTGKLSWCISVYNIAKEWMLFCQKTNMKFAFNSFETFEEAVYSIKITAIAWHYRHSQSHSGADTMNSSSDTMDFCFSTANGTIVFYKLFRAGSGGEETLELQFHKTLPLKQINCIEWFTVKHKKVTRSYAIACEMNGTINLLSVRYNHNENDSIVIDDVIEVAKLFDEADGVCANGIQWEQCKQSNQLIFVICKKQHVFAYLYSLDNESIQSSCIHYVGHLTINGKMMTIMNTDNYNHYDNRTIISQFNGILLFCFVAKHSSGSKSIIFRLHDFKSFRIKQYEILNFEQIKCKKYSILSILHRNILYFLIRSSSNYWKLPKIFWFSFRFFNCTNCSYAR